jgi:hypothetical protein
MSVNYRNLKKRTDMFYRLPQRSQANPKKLTIALVSIYVVVSAWVLFSDAGTNDTNKSHTVYLSGSLKSQELMAMQR